MAMDLLENFGASLAIDRVDISTFAESNDYCGKMLYPRQRIMLKLIFLEDLTDPEKRIVDQWENGGHGGTEVEISPGVRERVDYLRDNGYKHFREITFVGGRRSSKGFMTGVAMAKSLYDALHLQNPNDYYGIDETQEIYWACLAASESQAKEMQYSDFSSTVNSCEAMQNNIFKIQEKEFSVNTEADLQRLRSWKESGRRIQKDISKLRGKALPANARTARGYTMMAVCFDEFAHFLTGESDQSDEEVYTAVTPSMDQFGPDALIFCNSSPYTKIGKLYERFETGMSTTNGMPTVPMSLGMRFPSWAMFEGWWEEDMYYAGQPKCITVSPDWDINARQEDGSFYYSHADRQAVIVARQEEQQNPIKYRVERRGQFAEVIDAYLDPTMVDRMFAGTPYMVFDEMRYKRLQTNWNDSTYLNEYRMHLDPSSTTNGFGFALAHTEKITLNGKTQTHVIFDIIKRWDPKDFDDHVIDWYEVLGEVYHWIDLFRPQEITMDQFGKGAGIQMLRERIRQGGVSETKLYESTATLQHNWDKAEIFKTALYQNLVHAPFDTWDCEYAAQELKYLQELRTGRIPRVEAQEIGPVQTDDLFDCISEVTAGLIGGLIARQVRHELTDMPLAAGSPGGFEIGSLEQRTGNPNHLIRQWYSGQQSRTGDQRSAYQRPRSNAFYRDRPVRARSGGSKRNNPRRNPARGF